VMTVTESFGTRGVYLRAGRAGRAGGVGGSGRVKGR
jgi:hypothetical protein